MNNGHILIVRNDKIGDFMLAWPVFALLKHHWPEAQICALVPGYTAELARLCPWIDQVLIDDGEGAFGLSRKIARERFDVMLTLYSTGRVALAGLLARIPYRLAPATKLFQLLYNHRLVQRRSRSEKPEYAYNMDLALRLLADFGGGDYHPSEGRDGDYLSTKIPRPLLKAEGSRAASGLPDEGRLIIIHPGSGGSANNLRPEQYAALANHIDCTDCRFIISSGPGEEAIAEQVAAAIEGPASVYSSPGGLIPFSRMLGHADLFISGSTGPLHIAAALDRPTAAFYPRHRSATPLRWQTLNAPEKRLVFTPPDESDERCVQCIDVKAAAEVISRHLARGFTV